MSYWSDVYRPLNLRTASTSTIKLWQIAIRNFAEFRRCISPDLSDLNDTNLAAFASWRHQRVGAATVNRDLASLLALWRFASKRGDAQGWPSVQMCKEARRVPIAWTREEFDKLMAAARTASGTIAGIPAMWYWPALFLVAFDSGERIGAIMALEWQSVDLPSGWICFAAETRKGQRADSMVPIAPDTVEAVRRLKRRAGGYVFRGPIIQHIYGNAWASCSRPRGCRPIAGESFMRSGGQQPVT